MRVGGGGYRARGPPSRVVSGTGSTGGKGGVMPNFAQVGTRGLIRRRLLDELDALRSGPLALVVAPAGFGKTTLLSHYAHAFDGVVCWLSATPADADPA